MAGALAAELMVVLLHHPLGPSAPADKVCPENTKSPCVLGVVVARRKYTVKSMNF